MTERIFTRADAIAEVRAQHEELRALMDGCERLADQLDAGRVEPAVLLAEVVRLRASLATHNRFEEHLLGQVFGGPIKFEAHLSDHQDLRERLAGSPVTAELRLTLARMRAHLAAEEQQLG